MHQLPNSIKQAKTGTQNRALERHGEVFFQSDAVWKMNSALRLVCLHKEAMEEITRNNPKLNAGDWNVSQLKSTSPTSAAGVNNISTGRVEFKGTSSDSIQCWKTTTVCDFPVFLFHASYSQSTIPSVASSLSDHSTCTFKTSEKDFCCIVANPNFGGL